MKRRKDGRKAVLERFKKTLCVFRLRYSVDTVQNVSHVECNIFQGTVRKGKLPKMNKILKYLYLYMST